MINKKFYNQAFLILWLIFSLGCVQKEGKLKKDTRFYMGTYVTITIPEKVPNRILNQAFKNISILENSIKKFSETNIYDERIFSLVKKSLVLAELTEGTYEPTIKPLTDLWGMKNDNWQLPDKSAVQESLKRIGWHYINISSGSILIPEGMSFDLGGIGKGWIVDQTVQFLRGQGVREGIVEAGGDLKVWGARYWKVGLRNPYSEGLAAIIKLKNMAIASSGNYEKYFMKDSIKYHHLLDPFNGYPVDSNIENATVISEYCCDADALATALFIKGSSYVKKLETLDYKCITVNSNINYASDGIEIKWLEYDKN